MCKKNKQSHFLWLKKFEHLEQLILYFVFMTERRRRAAAVLYAFEYIEVVYTSGIRHSSRWKQISRCNSLPLSPACASWILYCFVSEHCCSKGGGEICPLAHSWKLNVWWAGPRCSWRIGRLEDNPRASESKCSNHWIITIYSWILDGRKNLCFILDRRTEVTTFRKGFRSIVSQEEESTFW